MANTEGLTDEALECLLGGEPMNTGSSALQRRLEMPMGGKPAAKVTRPSGRRPAAVGISSPPTQATEQQDERPPPLIGNIVEKRRTDRTTRPSGQTTRKQPSRFALQTKGVGGFPSLNKPLGSLVAQSNKSQTTTMSVTSSMNHTMENASETDRMISQMSPDEIRESVQELHQVLSPETIQFLKSRRKQQSQKEEQQIIEMKQTETSTILQMEPERKEATESLIDEEKERVAKLLASVRNYDDMDTLYLQEMGTDTLVVEGEKSEFQTACELLRSSVPRQILWAVRHLERCLRDAVEINTISYCLGTDGANDWPYPTLLPVSLRCLLDTSSSTVVGAQLQARSLSAFYHLASMRVPVDYVVYDVATGDLRATAAHLYMEYFLDDAVPSSTFQYASTNQMQPLSVEQSTVAYATSSSTTSAKDDGEAFLRDPLWTMLSRMRIIPWLATWLKSDLLPTESVRAAIGLLVLLVQRSPGAATAVVQHPSLLSDIVKQDSGSTLILQCVAARQSRSTACHLAMSDQIIQNLVSFTESEVSESNDKHHKWTLVLWRTLLRYGLALDALPTVLNLAARHITLGSDLSCYFFSAFSAVINCVVAANKSQENLAVGENTDERIITEDDRALLANATSWLSASRRQALRHLENIEESWLSKLILADATPLEKMKFYASIFRFLASWTRMCERLSTDVGSGDFKAEDFTELEEGLCLKAVLSCLKYDSIRELVGKILAGSATDGLFPSNEKNLSDLSMESASCSFVESLLELSSTLTSSGSNTPESVSSLQSIHQRITEITHQNSSEETNLRPPMGRCDFVERSRRYWLNRAHSSYLKFVSLSRWDLDEDGRADCTVALFNTIGLLDVGEESVAAILFSCDNLLCPTTQDSNGPSVISSWFVRGLCATPAGRAQLDHSFKLRGGPGISADRYGPFELQALLSTSPSMTVAAENLLPLGYNWLWKSLAGSILDNDAGGEALSVLLSTLDLSCELEALSRFQESSRGTAKSAGGRLYYLMNLLLKNEDILADQRIQTSAIRYINILYERIIDSNFVVSFTEECESHNSTRGKQDPKTEHGENSKDFQQLSKLIDPPEEREEIMTSSQIKSLTSFVNDICDAFLEYGAQFEFGRKCLNFFFSAYFPSKIKCDIIQRCRGTLHLITVDGEGDLKRCLRRCLRGGVACKDNSDRDTPGVLDAAVSILSEKDTARNPTVFVISWAAALLLRDLTGCLLTGENLLACRRRVLALSDNYSQGILTSVTNLTNTQGKMDDIINASTTMLFERTITEFPSAEAHWDHILDTRTTLNQ